MTKKQLQNKTILGMIAPIFEAKMGEPLTDKALKNNTDSLDFVELIMAFEDELDVEISDSIADEKPDTVKGLVAMVKLALEQK